MAADDILGQIYCPLTLVGTIADVHVYYTSESQAAEKYCLMVGLVAIIDGIFS